VIAVRAVRAGEQTPLRELRLRAQAQAEDAFGGSTEQVLAHPVQYWVQLAEGIGEDGGEAAVYVAIDEERWVGMAGARWLDRSRGIVQLWGMWVEPERRGEGTGARLVTAVRGWAQSRDARFLRLGVIEHSPAIPLYERLGFIDTGERKPLVRDPAVMATYMVRPA
jgi:GNAT superfamily N-acetyltransferase